MGEGEKVKGHGKSAKPPAIPGHSETAGRNTVRQYKRAEEALHNATDYRALIDQSSSIILEWDAAGNVLFLNSYGLEFFGFKPEEVLGRNVVGTIVASVDSTGNDLQTLMDLIQHDPGQFYSSENENVRKNGETVWIAWTNKGIYAPDGSLSKIISFGIDRTKQKDMEKQIQTQYQRLRSEIASRKQIEKELRQANVRLLDLDRLKSAFLATMSHELRTPLNTIIGFTGILQQELVGPLNDEQKKELGMVRDSSTHLLNLINDVLDISKIEAGQLTVATAPCDLRTAIQKVARNMHLLAQKKGLLLDVMIAPEVGTIFSDQRRVEQIILNLINNAIKFTEKGRILIECLPQNGEIITRVSDTGIGIKPGDMDQLFEPFYQIDTGMVRQYEGTGLGLSICKKILDLLGGRIWVESEWGKGSTFSFALTVQRES
jgi:PAS domain S-box-containing protein